MRAGFRTWSIFENALIDIFQAESKFRPDESGLYKSSWRTGENNYGDLPDPKPAPNQCLIKVAAVDVNPVDLYIRSGAVAGTLKFPSFLGRDLAGKVAAAGPKVNGLKEGDRVWAIGQGWDGRQGTFSELAAVDEDWLNTIPGNVTDEDIVAISLVGVTAYVGLATKANLKAGEILFVNGGTGGVGSSVRCKWRKLLARE